MGMIDSIKDYLNNNYPAYSFVRFGVDGIPSSPYGVIKGEKGIGGRNIRVILHRNVGEDDELETDLRAIIHLLGDKGFTSSGKYNRLSHMTDYTDVGVVSDDNTISMEALFLMPTTSF